MGEKNMGYYIYIGYIKMNHFLSGMHIQVLVDGSHTSKSMVNIC
jgi:hypothetical protein